MRASVRILAVAGAVDPEALARFVLHLEIIPNRDQLSVALPPFAEDALGTVGSLHAATHAAPGKGDGGMVGEECDRFDHFRNRQQAGGTRPMVWPCFAGDWRGRRDALDRALSLLPAGSLFGFAVTPTLLPDSEDADGRASGFPVYLRELWTRTDLLAETSYVHRRRPDGSDDLAVAFVGRTRRGPESPAVGTG